MALCYFIAVVLSLKWLLSTLKPKRIETPPAKESSGWCIGAHSSSSSHYQISVTGLSSFLQLMLCSFSDADCSATSVSAFSFRLGGTGFPWEASNPLLNVWDLNDPVRRAAVEYFLCQGLWHGEEDGFSWMLSRMYNQKANFDRMLCELNRVKKELLNFSHKNLRLNGCESSYFELLGPLQVEYLPLSSMEKSRQILDGFVEIWQEAMSKRSLPGHFMHIEPNFAEFGLSDHYTSQHTAVQYATVMAQLISAVQTAQGVRN
ncbi:Mediator of RNA polymerase II transcription subunit 20a [Vitis vinifera]|uniref:Mediator of RNA polymerase II transcription subunit 20 n=1 Tax=Vitis vinifera TaxID=29760 RepID=A0A438E8M2_VITVI|nr:Mediator of RNA polymerase II transcription subunit 20a [Vitis vinifera]